MDMPTFSRPQYQETICPVLLNRMEISTPEGSNQGNQAVQTLLRRLKMNETHLPLLERMTMSSMLDPQPEVEMGIAQETVRMNQGMKTMRNQPSKKS